MSFSIVHLSDTHFGVAADLRLIQAVEDLVPDLDARLIVISGDLTQRARHGEFQAARAFIRELERSAPVYALPGNHDVQWWKRPLVPFSPEAKYAVHRKYFGPVLAPTLDFPEVVVAGAVTAHGLAWGSLTFRPGDLTIKGHLPTAEMARVRAVFEGSRPEQARILVTHHNILRGPLTQRTGLAWWRRAQEAIMASGAELILCGHDHHHNANELAGRLVVSCTGTLSTMLRGEYVPVFHRIQIDDDAIQIDEYCWDLETGRFRRGDAHHFARPGRIHEAETVAATR